MNRIRQLLCLCCAALVAGCAPYSAQEEPRRGDRTRESVAKATERMKPELEWSARKLGAAAEWAAEETLAAVEGFFEGWYRPSGQRIDLNSASERQLESLPGITQEDARRIIRSRPYHGQADLMNRGVISAGAYRRIRDQIVVK